MAQSASVVWVQYQKDKNPRANDTKIGVCGCIEKDQGFHGDMVDDCIDYCPEDPLKTTPGQCGCCVPDIDADGDGVSSTEFFEFLAN